MVCDCALCCSREVLRGHFYTKPRILYFYGSDSSWHPVFTKLLGNILRVLGRKNQELPLKETVIKGMDECGLYSGIVTGVYMRGMVINLDDRVWLLVTDGLLNPPHTLRVGTLGVACCFMFQEEVLWNADREGDFRIKTCNPHVVDPKTIRRIVLSIGFP